MTHSTLIHRIAALVSAVALMAACTQSGAKQGASSSTTVSRQQGTTTSAGPATSTAEPSGTTDVDQAPAQWEECGSGLDCATITVPLDHENPDGPTIDIALLRRPARDPESRIGSLVVNPGGPGASGMALAGNLMLPGPVMNRFDIVGFDPRGVGRSTALDCHSQVPAIYDADPTIEDQADVDAFRTVSQRFVDECSQKHGDLLAHLGTVAVAHDLDRIRAAIGDDQLTYLGYSYGTAIGQQYAKLYPQRVRAMVLDGVVDLTETGLVTAEGQAEGFTRSLDAYVSACDARGCMDAPAMEMVDRVIARSEASPIPAPGADRPATPGVVSLALAQALYTEMFWPQLTRALTRADAGDGTGVVRLADTYLKRNSDGTYRNGTEVYFAVSCVDFAWPRSFDAVLDAAKAVGQRYPRLGEALVNDYARCALWPVPSDPLEPVPSDLEGLAPVMIVSTTGDPATPHAAGVAAAERIPDARLVTNVGEGHTVVGQGKPCIDGLVSRYLADLEAPRDGERCE